MRCQFVLARKMVPIRSVPIKLSSVKSALLRRRVAVGAELFVLRSDEVRTGIPSRPCTGSTDPRGHDREDGSRPYHPRAIKGEEIAQFERELEFRRTHAATSRYLVERLDRLARAGGVSQLELTRAQLALAESEKDLQVAGRSLEALKLERTKLDTERARRRTEEAADVQKLKFQIDALQRELRGTRDDLLSIRAPYDAVVISLAQRNAGSVVQPAQNCQLAPIGVIPYARLVVRESGLARLAIGQHVRLFFDAFPYQRYGTVAGELKWISAAAVASERGRQFIAAASLDRTFIRVKNEERPLRVGMQGEARIAVGSRALIEHAFEPIRQLRENLRQ